MTVRAGADDHSEIQTPILWISSISIYFFLRERERERRYGRLEVVVVVMVPLSDGSFVEGCGKGGVRWVFESRAPHRTG